MLLRASSRRRIFGVLASALAVLAASAVPDDAAAQRGRNRREVLLSDKPPARPGCRVAPRPSTLPIVDELVDLAPLREGLAAVLRENGSAEDSAFVLFSVAFDEGGGVERVQEIESEGPAAVVGAVGALMRRSLRPQRGRMYLRLRLHPANGHVLVGRSEICLPRGPEVVEIEALTVVNLVAPQPLRARVMVNAAGRSLSAVKLQGTGNDPIDEAVMRALSDLRFVPGLVDGIPTDMEFEHSVRFRAW